MVKVKILAKEQAKQSKDYYIVFDFLGRERRALVNDRVREFHNIQDLEVGQEINVLKQIKESGKDFYLITEVY